MPVKILIVGAGVAGLTAAIALAQSGACCELVEITASGQPVGAGITISGQAVSVLNAVGILEACQNLGTLNAVTGDAYDATGALIGDRPAGSWPSPPAVTIFRPILAEIMTGRARALGVTLRYGLTVRSLEQREGSVSVHFTDGSEGCYHLVVGADGIRSHIRTLLVGDTVRPLRSGQTSVRWMASGPPIPGPAMTYCASGLKLLSIALPAQNFVYVATVADRELDGHLDADGARGLLAEQLACFTAPYVVELAKRLGPQSDVIARPFEWLMVPDPWSRGRVLLIGDAAHATTAHLASGGGMAMEDGLVLAETLSDAASVEDALAAFMRRRFERVSLVVDGSLTLSKMEQEGATPDQCREARRGIFSRLAAGY